MSKIEVGKKAPPFTLEGTGGTWSLKDAARRQRGHLLLSARQHAGMHPGGRRALPRRIAQFKKCKALIVGISPDSVQSP